jgi:hypothetical protein
MPNRHKLFIEVVGTVPAGTEWDIGAAAAAAHAALEDCSLTPAERRAAYLVGMPIRLAVRIQAGLPIANFANYARIAREFRYEDRVGNSLVVKEPWAWSVPSRQQRLLDQPVRHRRNPQLALPAPGCSSARGFALRFLPTLGRPRAVAQRDFHLQVVEHARHTREGHLTVPFSTPLLLRLF